jgi:hypothetical protein
LQLSRQKYKSKLEDTKTKINELKKFITTESFQNLKKNITVLETISKEFLTFSDENLKYIDKKLGEKSAYDIYSDRSSVSEARNTIASIEGIITLINSNFMTIENIYKDVVNYTEDLKGAVRIYIRVKPNNSQLGNVSIEYPDGTLGNKMITYNGSGYGPYYDVYDTKKTNLGIYDLQKEMFEQVKDAYHVAIFGYGYSGSGKTYTILGDKNNPGVGIRAIYKYLDDGCTVRVSSVYELYYMDYNFFQARGLKSDNIKINKSTWLRIFDNFNKTIDKTDKISDLYEQLEKIKTARQMNGTIKTTINNPESSRSHFFITFEITTNESKKGYLTLCDMGGREDPFEILEHTYVNSNGDVQNNSNNAINFNQAIDMQIQNRERGWNIIKEIALGDYKEFKDMKDKASMIKQIGILIKGKYKDGRFHNDRVYQAFAHILETVIEGFFINETINHLTTFFKMQNGMKEEQISVDRLGAYETNKVFHLYEKDVTKIKSILENIKKNSSGKLTKFVMYGCIRSDNEDKYINFSKKTLRFAETIASTSTTSKSQRPQSAAAKRNKNN